MARPPNTEERREQIVEAMLRVMARLGYAKASVAKIAKEAGLAPGLVHYHFGSKQEILLALIERLGAMLEERRVRMGGDTAQQRLEAYLDAHLARGEDASPEAVACWVALGTEALAQPEVGAAYRAAVEAELATLVPLVRDALAERGASKRRAKTIASAMFAAIEGAFRLGVLAPGVIPAGSAAKTVRAMTEGLLRDAEAR